MAGAHISAVGGPSTATRTTLAAIAHSQTADMYTFTRCGIVKQDPLSPNSSPDNHITYRSEDHLEQAHRASPPFGPRVSRKLHSCWKSGWIRSSCEPARSASLSRDGGLFSQVNGEVLNSLNFPNSSVTWLLSQHTTVPTQHRHPAHSP